MRESGYFKKETQDDSVCVPIRSLFRLSEKTSASYRQTGFRIIPDIKAKLLSGWPSSSYLKRTRRPS
jgi:hypothetical protein